MPIGQPDSVPAESVPPSRVERLIGEAMAAGEFEGLSGTGRPIPGAGTTDDDLWWVHKWVERNRPADQ